MHPHVHPNSGVGMLPTDRAGETALPSGDSAWRRVFRFGPRALKPLTYSLMHLVVAISVAFALTRDWRIALGVGLIEPMVQTLAYMLHEKAWSLARVRKDAAGTGYNRVRSSS